ncbi:MAG: Fpg/Nei family DNA glycosylase [Actinomycetota bacterium]|nr:Fpg/Nei family DNA glycosylase [Actinomycetota bacterium]
MPELPEVQALAERLDDAFGGSIWKGAQVIQFSGLKTFDPPPEQLVGREVRSVGRRGKFVIMELDGLRVLFHLSQGGRVDLEDPPKSTRPKFGVVRFLFEDRPAILLKEFGTERKAGWWVLPEGDDGPLEALGPEPFSEGYEDLILEGQDGRRIHTLLRDQRTVAGIGRGFSDDILHRAELSPFASLKSLSEQDRRRLLESTRKVLGEALSVERRRTGGLPTKLGDRFAVHGRFGQPCPRCRSTLQRVSYESHEVAYCPACQTGGKTLADRRLSRLIK